MIKQLEARLQSVIRVFTPAEEGVEDPRSSAELREAASLQAAALRAKATEKAKQERSQAKELIKKQKTDEHDAKKSRKN